jgi:hypothetical protein
VLAERGHLDAAGALVAAHLPELQDMVHDSEWLPMMCQIADVATRVRDHALAAWSYEVLAPWEQCWVVEGIGAVVRGPAARFLAALATVLGDDAAAARHRELAVTACERAGASRLAAVIADAATSRPAAAPAEPRGRDAARVGHELCRVGESWRLTFGGVTVLVQDRKGLRDLARLLTSPGTEIAAIDLASPAGGRDVMQRGVERLDEQARAAYRRRLAELDDELDEADRHSDLARSAALSAEREAIMAELASAYGLGGRARRSGDTAERARTAVTARIKDALRRIEAVHPDAAAHLTRAVRTGTFCAYDPHPAEHWVVAEN